MLAVGSQGAGFGQFNDLRGLSLTSDEMHLLVCDAGNHCVVVADARDGRSLRELRGPVGTLAGPMQAIVVPQSGQVLVVDRGRGLVVVFVGLDDDTVVRTLGDGQGHGPRQLKDPRGLAILDGDAAAADAGPVAVVVDTNNTRLSLFRVCDGTLMQHLGSKGMEPGQFLWPSAVAVVPARATGNDETWLVVADEGNWRVQVLTCSGEVVRILKVMDAEDVIHLGRSMCGVTVCVTTGEVLLTDSAKHRVLSWCIAGGGKLRVVCGGLARMDSVDTDDDESNGDSAPTGLFNGPFGVVVSGDGALWVADSNNHRLCLFR